MLLYILLVVGSNLQNDQKSDQWREWDDLKNEVLNEINFGRQRVENINSSQIFSSNIEKICHKSPRSCYENFSSSTESASTNNDSVFFTFISDFLHCMKTDYLKSETCRIKENIPNVYNCTKMFFDLLETWENEKLDSIKIKRNNKFPDNDSYIKYQKISKRMARWFNNFSQIKTIHLPQIIKKLAESSIDTYSKASIIENTNCTIRAMAYFEKLRPKNFSFRRNTDTLNLYYTTMLDRFPYLFDYFNLCGRFVYLYGLLIELYIKKVNESSEMEKILYNMSINLNVVLKYSNNFLKDLQTMLTMLEHLEPAIK
ncbi:putative SP-containing protein [Vairimorpha necatrix]|uniref:SP-containing protein n=1 Tax=Vairimorpha necatrix TaxID=6039 RepID=A0AAX4JEL2_9MICR